MKTVLVRYYDPQQLGFDAAMSNAMNAADLKKHCVIVNNYATPAAALDAYANTTVTWSTLLDNDADVDAFIDEAVEHILMCDFDWLEQHFV